jgi:hypothetical protein
MRLPARLVDPGFLRLSILVKGTPVEFPPLGDGELASCDFTIAEGAPPARRRLDSIPGCSSPAWMRSVHRHHGRRGYDLQSDLADSDGHRHPAGTATATVTPGTPGATATRTNTGGRWGDGDQHPYNRHAGR